MEDTVRTIYDFCVERRGDLVEFSVTGDGFLYNMVRIMVGTLLDMGRGKIECSPEVIRTIIAGKKRSRAGYTAPAHGLYLDRVFMSRSRRNRPDNITDLRQLRKERGRKRTLKRLGIFLGVVCGVALAVLGVQEFFRGNYIQEIRSFGSMYLPGDGYPVEVLGSDVVDLQNADGNLAVVAKSRILYLNPNGRKVEEIKHNLYNVESVCYRGKTLIYDQGGNDLKVYSGSRLLFEQSYPKSIYCADLSSGGNLAVATGRTAILPW